MPGSRRPRYLTAALRRDLARKMAFVAGPRQVGKTTLALGLPGARDAYLNWDIARHRDRILRGELPAGAFWIFDEIHKYRRWRNYLKARFPEADAWQISAAGTKDYRNPDGVRVAPAAQLLRTLV